MKGRYYGGTSPESMHKAFFIPLLFCFLCANSQGIPPFKQLRFDEDYSFLGKDSLHDWYTKMKFTALSKDRNTFISYGGDIRFQYFYTKNEGWGDEPTDNNGYTLTRFLAHADLHKGKNFRTFVQLQSSLANSRPFASPVDDNPLELHQAFFDININTSAASKLVLRTGRQEMMYGSQRLVAVRDNPNNRQSFDAIRAIYLSPQERIDVFYSHYVAARKDIFNDGFNRNTKFWGLYLTRSKLPLLKNIDLYYLGLWKRRTTFDDGNGAETRHSMGLRIWNANGNWKYDLEALYQFGTFADKDISAWTSSINTSYLFRNIKFRPEVGLKAELISGDKEYDDNKLQTFNPLFPRGAYFGLAALIGPANLIDLHPSLSLSLAQKLTFDAEYDIFWRYSRHDGLYAVNVVPIYSGKAIPAKYIGGQLAGTFTYRPNNFLYFRGEITWFNTGDYLREAGTGKDILFTGVTAQLKF